MKSVNAIASLEDIKSIHSVGVRSIPKAQRSNYLELYMLKREKDRLEKVIFSLDKRRSTAVRQLKSIATHIKRLLKKTHEKEGVKTYREIPTRPMKTMAINY